MVNFLKIAQESRLKLIYILTVSFLLASIAISHKLWFGATGFPATPLLGSISVKYPMDLILFSSTILILLLNGIYYFNKKLHLLLLSLLIFLILVNINRLQPWFYYYLLIVFSFLHFQPKNEKATHTILKLIASGSIIWFGINKLKPAYFDETLKWMSHPFSNQSEWFGILATLFASAIPLLEIIIGIGLWINKSKKIAIGGIILIQLFYLTLISPLFYNAQASFWIFHLFISLLVPLAFGAESNFKSELKILRNNYLGWMILALVSFFPFLNLFNFWNSNLSFNMYSGGNAVAKIYISENLYQFIPDETINHFNNPNNKMEVDLKKWMKNETGFSPFPSLFVAKNSKKYFLRYTQDNNEIIVSYQAPQNLFSSPDPIVE